MSHRNAPAVSVRKPMCEGDHSAIRSLFVELQEHGRASDARLSPGEEIADSYLESLMRKCEQYEGCFFVAELSGEVCGYVCVLAKVPCTEPADGLSVQAEVIDLVVSKFARSAGVGRALLANAEDFSTRAGARFLRVSVFASNHSAVEFYEHAGYTEHEVVYEKQLSPTASHGT